MQQRPEIEVLVTWWKKELERHAQPWREWEALCTRVAGLRFDSLDCHDPSGTVFTLGGRDELGELHRRIAPAMANAVEQGKSPSTRYEKVLLIDALLPPWLAALWGLNIAAFAGGGIADHLSDEKRGRIRLQRGTVDRVVEVLGNPLNHFDPSEVTLPEGPLYPLQTTSSGTVFWVDDNRLVLGFCPASASFEVVGELEPFIRLSLDQIARGKPWHHAYNPTDLARYGLRYVERS